jgi:hypothetical protein
MAAGFSEPSRWRPNITAPISQAHAADLVERAGERLSCVLQPRPRVDEHCVPAGRLHNRHAERDKPFADLGVGAGAIGEIVLVDHFAQALRDRFEIATGQAAHRSESRVRARSASASSFDGFCIAVDH